MCLDETWPRDDAAKREACRAAGVVPEHHCCLNMAFAISRPVLTPHQGPNRIIDWLASWNEYRVPVTYDGYASALIRFCPWCAQALPPSRREEWYQALYALGYSDPGGDDDVPEQFNTDAWWRRPAGT